jgi:hypothetical protein
VNPFSAATPTRRLRLSTFDFVDNGPLEKGQHRAYARQPLTGVLIERVRVPSGVRLVELTIADGPCSRNLAPGPTQGRSEA